MEAIRRTATQNTDVLNTLKLHIGMGLKGAVGEDKSLDIQVRIAEINAEFKRMLDAVSADMAEGSFNEERMTELMLEKRKLENEFNQYVGAQQKRNVAKNRLDEIVTVLEGLANHPMTFDDQLIRQILESIVVESKETIKIILIGGLEVSQPLNA